MARRKAPQTRNPRGNAPDAPAIRPQAGPQEGFLSSSADIVLYGGAAFGGKTWGLLAEPLRHIGNGQFGAVCFRRTSPQITNEGGLWDEAMKVYPLVGGRPYESAPKSFRFPSGARVTFSHLQYDATVLNYQGSQIPLIMFDELTHFTEHQFWYMVSRNRSGCGVRPYIRATTNPDADSWVAKLIQWWWNPETGYAIPERAGVIRWFYRISDEIHWYDTKDEARQAHPELAAKADPKSFTFIPASPYDNRIGLAKDPGYITNLYALANVEKERLLLGNWKIRRAKGTFFRPTWFEDGEKRFVTLEDVLRGEGPIKWAFYWDSASSDSEKADFTVGVLMAKRWRPREHYYIVDVVRGQWSPARRREVMREVALRNLQQFPGTSWYLELPPGEGRVSLTQLIDDLWSDGVSITGDSVTAQKTDRATPLSIAMELGHVSFVKGEWFDAFKGELTAFPDPNTHDDQVDAASGAYNMLRGEVDLSHISDAQMSSMFG